eukprot:jgi/Ulvmu1/5508/UM023_0044.1
MREATASMSNTRDENATVAGPTIKTAVVVKFMFFSALMVATPTAVFFLSHFRYLDWLWAMTVGVPSDNALPALSGIAAVICVNIVVGCFIIMAFRESDVTKDKRRGVKSD